MEKRRTIRAADLFCGAGGSSTGLAKACATRKFGLKLTAINHWDVAIKTHSKNHSDQTTLCNRIDELDPIKVVPEGRLDILIGSPECTHHSNARGGKPMNDQSRSSGWDILRWLEKLYVSRVLLENVKEWESWGPIGADGRPLKSRKGETFQAFIRAMESLGYRVEYKILCCAYYGDPTSRERLFLMARRDGRKIVWPNPTHSPTGEVTLFGPTKKFKSARSIIDWNKQGKSIFNRKKPLSPTTMARIFAGLRKFSGIDIQNIQCYDHVDGNGVPLAPEAFILPHQHGNDGTNNVRSVEQPLPAVTASSNDMFVAEPYLVQLNGTEKGHIDPSAKSVDRPLPTIAGTGHSALIQPFIMATDNTGGNGDYVTPADRPLPTQTSKERFAVIEPFLIGAGGPTGCARPKSVDKPLNTVMVDNRIGICEPMLIGQQSGAIARSVEDPVPTISTKGAIAMAEPFLVPFFGERKGQDPRVHSINEPVPTVTGQGAGGLVEPFMVEVNHGDKPGRELSRVHSVNDPMSTMTAKNNKALIEAEAFLIDAAYGVKPGEKDPNSRRAHSLDKPLGTVTGSKSKALCQPYLVKYNSTGGPRSVDDPLDTVTCKDRYGLVIPGLEGYILDIRFRMLTPSELAGAMSFPQDYVFEGTREENVKMIGNAVPVMTSMALCDALLAS